MKNEHKYTIERYTHGWILKAAPGRGGVPMEALTELTAMCPSKQAVMATGVANYYGAVFAVGLPRDVAMWEAEIEAILATATDQEYAWYKGTRVGLSSLTIFAALADQKSVWAMEAKDRVHHGYVPSDAPDFERCEFLLCKFPEWRKRLSAVHAMFPGIGWDKLVANWDRLAKITGYEALTAAMKEALK